MGTGWRRAFCTSIRGDPDHSVAYTTTLPSPSSSSASLHKKLRNSHQPQHQDDAEEQTSPPPLPIISISKLSSIGTLFGGSSSNPSTPRSNKKKQQPLSANNSARSSPSIDHHVSSSPPPPPPPLSLESNLQCNTNAGVHDNNNPDEINNSSTKKKKPSKLKDLSPRLPPPKHSSSPSLKSPSRFALLKTALRLSRNPCGICGESVSQKTAAIFTAECSHSFHFPCISSHVNTTTKKQTSREGRTRLLCPVCSADWHQVPLLSSSSNSFSHDSQPPAATKSLHKTNSSSSNKPETINRGGRRQSSKVATSKIYDDDESLQLSPTTQSPNGMSQFNSIPEELEEEDEDEVTPSNSTTSSIDLIPDSVALVSTGLNHLNYVVSIKLKAPKLPPKPQSAAVPSNLLDHPSCRAPIDLVTVLDVSGNMTSEKLQMLKHATRSVISSMGPGDRLSIVAFSMAAAKRLLPLRRMSRQGQRSARQIIDRLVVCGSNQVVNSNKILERLPSSCMGDALRKATKVLEDRRERNPVATIMLLSDGQGQEQSPQEQNIADRKESNQNMQRATRFSHIEIPIHSHASEEQKQEKQESNVFASSVNGVVKVVLQDTKLHFTLSSVISGGAEISSVYSFSTGNSCDIGQGMSDGGRGKFVCLGDLYEEEERELLVEIRVPKTAVVEGSVVSTLSVACSYRNPLSRDVICREEKLLNLPNSLPLYQFSGKLLRSNSSSSSSSSRPTTPSSLSVAEAAMASQLQLQQQQQLRNLFVTIRALAESRGLVELGDMDTALHLLSSARTLLFQQSSTSLSSANKSLLPSLEAELGVLQKQQKQRKMRYRQQRSMSPSLRNRSNGEHALLLADVRGGGGGGGGEREPLTPTSAWRSAEQLAKVAIMRKSLNRVSDLHGFENARF